ncbi:MAG: hypothetical protein ACFNVK_13380, partial [Prevotella sp.]
TSDWSVWSDWSVKLTKLMGFSHFFTFSPFHLFAFKRALAIFSPFHSFTFKYVSDERELGMQGWQCRATNLQNTAGTAQPCIMPKIS